MNTCISERTVALLLATCCMSSFVSASPSGDRPDERHAWAVHDAHRPNPPKITAEEGRPPSDAIVLFDGTAESVAKHWRDASGGPSKWTVKDGLFICTPRSGGAFTREEFGACQLHLEWLSPVGDPGLGNSGAILMSCYEVQILNSDFTDLTYKDRRRANYADGQAGAIYGQSPPLVNPARPTGVWQTYDIIFHPPLWDGDQLIDPGSITVFFNGVLVQDAWPLEGRCHWQLRTKHEKAPPTGPLRLQDHGNPVPFRNIWIRRIPSRFANTVHGGPGVKLDDVAAKRAELAAHTLALAEEATELTEKVICLYESLGYRSDPAVKAKAEDAAARYAASLDARDSAACRKIQAELRGMKLFVDMLIRNGLTEREFPLAKAVARALDEAKKQ